MRAIYHTKYGPPEHLQLKKVEKPSPQENEILVEVRAASINAADYRFMRANPWFVRLMGVGLLRPQDPRLGSDVAGQVEAVGENVRQFRPGDEVFGGAKGAFAEYVLAKEVNLARKPANRSFEQAAAVPGAGVTALQAIRHAGGIRPGQQVLIQGASGGVGTFAVQLAKLFGAEVTAVCSTRNLDLARSLRADHIIDYTQEDFSRNQQRYDLILAVNGYRSLSTYRRALKPHGTYVCAGGTMAQFFQAMLLGPLRSSRGGQRMGSMGIAKVNQEDLTYLGALLEAGDVVPVIDHCYRLSDVPEAFRYLEEQHAQGKVVITVEGGP